MKSGAAPLLPFPTPTPLFSPWKQLLDRQTPHFPLSPVPAKSPSSCCPIYSRTLCFFSTLIEYSVCSGRTCRPFDRNQRCLFSQRFDFRLLFLPSAGFLRTSRCRLQLFESCARSRAASGVDVPQAPNLVSQGTKCVI